jgi:myo-inositol-1-phosphate synthase
MTRKIKIALIGIGNSASSLVQGLTLYKKDGSVEGIWHPVLGGYKFDDIEIVEAFDINPSKIDNDLSEAIFSEPNQSPKYVEVPNLDVSVKQGVLLDSFPSDMNKLIGVSKMIQSNEITDYLMQSGVDTVLNLISSGLEKTVHYYAESALKAGCSFINCTPTEIASNSSLVSQFKEKDLVVVGDDLMSQFGGTVFHKGILEFMNARGIRTQKSYQLDVGGGIETLNTMDEKNKQYKKDVKTSAVKNEVPYDVKIVTGTTEYVPFMGNNRTSYYWVSGRGLFGSPVNIDIYLRSNDGANAVNILLDIIRSVQASRDKGNYGAPNEICTYGFKKPPNPIRLNEVYPRFYKEYIK